MTRLQFLWYEHGTPKVVAEILMYMSLHSASRNEMVLFCPILQNHSIYSLEVLCVVGHHGQIMGYCCYSNQ